MKRFFCFKCKKVKRVRRLPSDYDNGRGSCLRHWTIDPNPVTFCRVKAKGNHYQKAKPIVVSRPKPKAKSRSRSTPDE